MKTWCANTYKHYLWQQTISGKTHFKKKSGLYNVVLGEGEEIFLQKITSIDVTTMDLKWHSKIYTYVELVKASTQEPTVFF